MFVWQINRSRAIYKPITWWISICALIWLPREHCQSMQFLVVGRLTWSHLTSSKLLIFSLFWNCHQLISNLRCVSRSCGKTMIIIENNGFKESSCKSSVIMLLTFWTVHSLTIIFNASEARRGRGPKGQQSHEFSFSTTIPSSFPFCACHSTRVFIDQIKIRENRGL